MKGYPPMFCNIIKTFLQSQEKNSPTVRASDACSKPRFQFPFTHVVWHGSAAAKLRSGTTTGVYTKPPPKGL